MWAPGQANNLVSLQTDIFSFLLDIYLVGAVRNLFCINKNCIFSLYSERKPELTGTYFLLPLIALAPSSCLGGPGHRDGCDLPVIYACIIFFA
jgi:hypothetical protein